jgi:hypothetical protein
VLWDTTIRGTLCDKHGSRWDWWRVLPLRCKPSSLISCHLVPKLRTSEPTPETSLQETALHFRTAATATALCVWGLPVCYQLMAARSLSLHYNVYEHYNKNL